MDSSNEEVLLFSVKLSSAANQKRKRRECEKYLKKKQNKEFPIVYCRRYV